MPADQNHPVNEHKKGVAEYFSDAASYWDGIYNDTAKENFFEHVAVVDRQNQVLRLLRFHVAKSAGVLLEAGCGAGQLLKRISDEGYSVSGLDLSYAMAKQTRQRLLANSGFLGCVVGDVEHLPFKSDSFAALASVGVLQYLPNDKHSTKEFCRVVKKEGKVLITLPNFFRVTNIVDPIYVWRFAEFLVSRFRKKSSRRFTADDYRLNRDFASRRYRYGQLTVGFICHGFRLVDVATVGFGPFTLFKREVFPRKISLKISRFFEVIAEKKGFKWIAALGNRWIYCYGGFQKTP